MTRWLAWPFSLAVDVMARQRTDDMRPVPVITVSRCIISVDFGVEVDDFAMVIAKNSNSRIRCIGFCVNTRRWWRCESMHGLHQFRYRQHQRQHPCR